MSVVGQPCALYKRVIQQIHFENTNSVNAKSGSIAWYPGLVLES